MRYPTEACVRAAIRNPSPKMLEQALELAIKSGFRRPRLPLGTKIASNTILVYDADPNRTSSPQAYMIYVLTKMAENANSISSEDKYEMVLEECAKIARAEGLEVDGENTIRRGSDGEPVGAGSIRAFYNRALINVNELIVDKGLDFLGAVCPEHPELVGKRQVTTYRCVGCQRISRDTTKNATGWAREKVAEEIKMIGVGAEPAIDLDGMIEKLSLGRGWTKLPSGEWYDPKTGKKHSRNYLYNDAQAVLRQQRLEQRHQLQLTSTGLPSTMPAHEIQEIITDLQMEINEEEGLQYSIPEEAWYDPDTGKKYPKSHGRDKATALFKQRISVFGTHKVPEPGVAMEQYKAVAHDKAQSEPQHQRKNQKKVAEVTDDDKAATVARKLEEKMETAKRMEEQRKAKQEAKHAAKLAKAKAEANARAEKFKADPLSRWK